MSPLPDRSPQSSKPPLPTESMPASQQPPAASDASVAAASARETVPDSASTTAPEAANAEAVPPASAAPAPLVPKRPLMRPVNRPQPPATPPTQKPEVVVAPPKPELTPVPVALSQPAETPEAMAGQALIRQQPIPPPSEPKQYRAIGLVRGRYTPSDEQFTRGAMLTSDGTEVEAVLLGRVMSLVRNHLDLEQQHLWVVYPRTREMRQDLHVQIVGVWEPEKLNKEDEAESAESNEAIAAATESDQAASHEAIATATEPPSKPTSAPTSTPAPAASVAVAASSTPEESGFDENYFSIRGEVVFYAADEQQIVVKIQQAPRKTADREKAFKLRLDGVLTSPKALGYFWDLQVERRGPALVVTSGTPIGLVPPKKKTASAGFKRVGDRRPPQRKARPAATRNAAPAGAPRREPLPKPVKRTEAPGEG